MPRTVHRRSPPCTSCAQTTHAELIGFGRCSALRDLFALWHLQQQAGEFVEAGYLSAPQVELVREGVRGALRAVRPDAVALCDGWGFSDHALNSTLGRFDGDVYTALYASAQPALNPMNSDEVDAAFAESVRQLRDVRPPSERATAAAVVPAGVERSRL